MYICIYNPLFSETCLNRTPLGLKNLFSLDRWLVYTGLNYIRHLVGGTVKSVWFRQVFGLDRFQCIWLRILLFSHVYVLIETYLTQAYCLDGLSLSSKVRRVRIISVLTLFCAIWCRSVLVGEYAELKPQICWFYWQISVVIVW